MDLTPYVERVRRELLMVADAAGEDGRALAERLVSPLDSALRLSLLHALSTAADEITRELAPGSVDVRLRGTDPGFVVTTAPVEPWAPPQDASVAPPMAPPPPEEEGATARINFRPPEHLKSRIEEAAGREGLSVNAWLVRAVSSVLGNPPERRPSSSSGNSFTGWVR
jgi:hypothetical protein